MNAGLWLGALPYFSERELRCRGTGIIKLDLRFAAAFPELRRAWGRPLFPTSVCRSPAHNTAVGGHPRSLHLTENPHHPVDGTMAADLRWNHLDYSECEKLYHLALDLGWSCGLHEHFLHVDRRGDFGLPRLTFHYPSWDSPFPDR